MQTFIDSITGNGLPADIYISEKYLESWPWEFSRSLVLMIYQMIKHKIDSFRYWLFIICLTGRVFTCCYSNYLTDVVEGKSLFIKTILIPFCIEYGQHSECCECIH